MVKSLIYKAETFNGYYKKASIMETPVKEACFDMQVLFVDFFTSSIKYIHGDDEVSSERKQLNTYLKVILTPQT